MTLLLIGFTVLVSILGFQNRDVIIKMKHWPYEEARTGEYFRWLTAGFVHADWMHLGVNMFVLWSFGTQVEGDFEAVFGWGKTFYLAFYLLAIVAAGLPGYQQHRNNVSFASIGASGAVSAVTFGRCWRPRQQQAVGRLPEFNGTSIGCWRGRPTTAKGQIIFSGSCRVSNTSVIQTVSPTIR